MPGSVCFFAEGIIMPKFKKRETGKWIKEIIEAEQKSAGALNYIFVSDNQLLETNKKHLNHEYLTDIITFDTSEEPKVVEGDIYISVDRVKENSKIFSTTFHVELYRVMIHGVLHLCGYKDKTLKEEKQMRLRENEALEILTKTQGEQKVPRETPSNNV